MFMGASGGSLSKRMERKPRKNYKKKTHTKTTVNEIGFLREKGEGVGGSEALFSLWI